MNPRAHIQEAREEAEQFAKFNLPRNAKLLRDLADALEACLDQQNQLAALLVPLDVAREHAKILRDRHDFKPSHRENVATLVLDSMAEVRTALFSVLAGSAGGGATP